MHQASSSSTSRRILVVLALLLFIVALLLVIIQSYMSTMSKKSTPILGTYSQGYADGYNEARDFAKSMYPDIDIERMSLMGTVTDVQSDRVSFLASGLFVDEAVDGVDPVRTALVDDSTVIVERKRVSAEEMERRNDAYNRAMMTFDPASDETPPAPPLPWNETVIPLSSIQEGELISVRSAADQDLTFEETFTASEISVTRNEGRE